MQGGQESTGTLSLEDDMAEGDLGVGMGLTPGPTATIRKKSRSASRGGGEDLPSGTGIFQREGQKDDTTSVYSGLSRPKPLKQLFEGERNVPPRRLRRTESLGELSKEELRQKLQEATEEADLLRVELEVAHRYLEGKYEALKILQAQAILGKATSHTKSLLQKSDERTKSLEREVNSLQWEITFNQVQLKNFEQTWEQKYDSLCSENRALSSRLEERVTEVQSLRAENAALGQQCLELFAMLSVREQRAFQATKPLCGQGREGTVLEMAVLGACRCLGPHEPCPCARSAAASRKQLFQLRQELDAQRRRRDEALMTADAFRIAFEQQLRRRSEHFLFLAEADRLKSCSRKSEGGDRKSSASVAQRLKGVLPSNSEVKMSDDPTETLHRLLDLLNDKEEALAHQRKVSLMLAHSAEELERRLQSDSRFQHQEPLSSKFQPNNSLSTTKLSPSESSQIKSVAPSKFYPKQSVPDFKPPPKDVTSDSMSLPKDVTSHSMPPPKDVTSDSVSPPKDVTSESKPPPKDVISDSMPPPKDGASDSMPAPKDITSDSMPPPKDITSHSTPPPKDVTSDCMSPPKDVTSDFMPPPKDVTSDPMPPPKDEPCDCKFPSKDVTSYPMPLPKEVTSDSMPPPKDEPCDCKFPSKDVTSDSMPLPKDVTCDFMSPPKDVTSDCMSPPKDVTSDPMPPPKDVTSDSMPLPKDEPCDCKFPSKDVTSDSMPPPKDVTSDSMPPPKDVTSDSMPPLKDEPCDSKFPSKDLTSDS